MILSQLKDYLRERGQATLLDVALHFGIDPDTARGMLEIWVRKGRIHRRMATASCGTRCSQCDSAATEIYVWGEAPGEPVRVPGCTH